MLKNYDKHIIHMPSTWTRTKTTTAFKTAVSNTSSNLIASLRSELFRNICFKDSCCFMQTHHLGSSPWATPRTTTLPEPHGTDRAGSCAASYTSNNSTYQLQTSACSAPPPAQRSSTCKRPFQVRLLTLYQRFTLRIFCLFPSFHPYITQGHKNFGENLIVCGWA